MSATPHPPIAAPSILSADFSKLGAELAIVDRRRDWVHCDVMDNHFVPNLTFGPLLVHAVRKLTKSFLDVHLMIDHPQRLVNDFRNAGADQITIHQEAPHDTGMEAALTQVHFGGAKAGLALRPGTPLEAAEPYLDKLDLLLIMTVEPGFGGQPFMENQLAKIEAALALRQKRGLRYLIEVDGGITAETARRCREAGADVFVAGSSIFHAEKPGKALEALREAVAARSPGAT